MKKLIAFLIIALTSISFGSDIVNDGNSNITYFVMRDKTAGTVDTGVVIANLQMYYIEDQAAESADAFVGSHVAATDAYTSGECFHIGHGVYRADFPDAAFDGGIGTRVQLILVDGDGGAFTEILEVQLSPPVDVQTVLGVAPFDSSADTVLISSGTGAGQLSLVSGTVLLRSATESAISTINSNTATTKTNVDTLIAEKAGWLTATSVDLNTDALDSTVIAAGFTAELLNVAITDITADTDPGATPTYATIFQYLYYELIYAKKTATATLETMFNAADVAAYQRIIGTDGTTTTRSEVTEIP